MLAQFPVFNMKEFWVNIACMFVAWQAYDSILWSTNKRHTSAPPAAAGG
jgi:hypothetical protein